MTISPLRLQKRLRPDRTSIHIPQVITHRLAQPQAHGKLLPHCLLHRMKLSAAAWCQILPASPSLVLPPNKFRTNSITSVILRREATVLEFSETALLANMVHIRCAMTLKGFPGPSTSTTLTKRPQTHRTILHVISRVPLQKLAPNQRQAVKRSTVRLVPQELGPSRMPPPPLEALPLALGPAPAPALAPAALPLQVKVQGSFSVSLILTSGHSNLQLTSQVQF